jgi:hypothetical protein
MVSKTLASLDAWLALAEEVLAEQRALQEKAHRPEHDEGSDQVPALHEGSSHAA